MEAPNELWEWLRLLNRRKALIIGAGLLAVALMALIIAQATPMYKASSAHHARHAHLQAGEAPKRPCPASTR